MAQWARLTRAEPSAQEWRALRAMDMAFIEAKRIQTDQKQQEAEAPYKVSARPMSPKLFDALFQK